MWFAKWFGGRKAVQEEDDEPARHSPPTVSRPAPALAPQVRQASASKHAPKKGFDPYNSGAFEHRKAWERVSRR